jgi:hypothetical protein
MWQMASYIYYYIRIVVYEDCIKYEYHTSLYASIFIFPFIGIREYLFDKETIFYGETIEKYANDTLKNFYFDLSESANQKDQYQNHFPAHFRNFMNELYTTKICELVLEFTKDYPENGDYNCSNFFFGSPNYGLLDVLAMYIEEIRSIRDIIDKSYIMANEKNFTYNESYFQDPKGNYERLIKTNIDKLISMFNGAVISNIGQLSYFKNASNDFKLIANYTMNVFNIETIKLFKQLGFSKIVLSLVL